MDRFNGRNVLVTGAASGIGQATARRLASEGASVAVADVDEKRAAETADEIGGVAVGIDVCDPASIDRAVLDVEQSIGPVDVLVNNAGGSRIALFVDTKEEDWDFDLRLNLRGAMSCSRAVIRGMYERREGTIVNVSSEAARAGVFGGAGYAAAKAGLLGFTRALAHESAMYGVRVNAVAPGPTETALLAGLRESPGLGAAVSQGMIDATLMGRAGRTDEIAAAIAYLASDDASFVTGAVLSVSGGVMA